MSTLQSGGLFLISTLFDLYLFVLMVRLLLCWVGANALNPFVQVIIKLTQRVIAPLRKILPNMRTLETATLVMIILVELIKYFLIGVITTGMPNFLGLMILAGADILKLLLDTFFYAILLQVILSWIQSGFTPVNQVLGQITAPIMRPFRRWIPLVAGMDISPIPALIVLQLLTILLVKPLILLGLGVAF